MSHTYFVHVHECSQNLYQWFPQVLMKPLNASIARTSYFSTTHHSVSATFLPETCKIRKTDTWVRLPLGRQAKFICDLALRYFFSSMHTSVALKYGKKTINDSNKYILKELRSWVELCEEFIFEEGEDRNHDRNSRYLNWFSKWRYLSASGLEGSSIINMSFQVSPWLTHAI